MQKHYLNKVAIGLIVIALISLLAGVLAGVLTGKHPTRNEFAQIEHDSRPERPPEIIGQIESIIGNKITIAKLEDNKNRDRLNPEKQRDYFESLTPEERIVEMEKRLNAFTGENIVVEIPAGIEITRRIGPPKNVAEVHELAFSKEISAENGKTVSPTFIEENDFIAVWLNENILDQNVAELINIIFTRQNAK